MLKYLIPPKGRYRQYRGRFRVGDSPRVYEVTLPTTVKEVAEKLLKERHEDMQREVTGLIPPGYSRQAQQKPLMELFNEYLDDMRRRGRASEYIRMVRTRFPVLAAGCHWNSVRDINAKSFATWRNAQTRYSPRTLNHFLTDAKTFLNWVDRTYEVPNVLMRAQKLSVDPLHPEGPRAFTEDELSRIFAANPKWRLLYRLLAFTGLRRKEAKDLIWSCSVEKMS